MTFLAREKKFHSLYDAKNDQKEEINEFFYHHHDLLLLLHAVHTFLSMKHSECRITKKTECLLFLDNFIKEICIKFLRFMTF